MQNYKYRYTGKRKYLLGFMSLVRKLVEEVVLNLPNTVNKLLPFLGSICSIINDKRIRPNMIPTPVNKNITKLIYY